MPHDTYGSHLDGNRNTTDKSLEKKNFYAAAGVLAEIWSGTVIDNHPVHCKVMEKGCHVKAKDPDPVWVANPVCQHRYGLQIVKCLKR